jgi:hypothetical protein
MMNRLKRKRIKKPLQTPKKRQKIKLLKNQLKVVRR